MLVPAWKGEPHKSEYTFAVGYLHADFARGTVSVLRRSESAADNANRNCVWTIVPVAAGDAIQAGASNSVIVNVFATAPGTSPVLFVLRVGRTAAHDGDNDQDCQLQLVPATAALGPDAQWVLAAQ